MAGKSFASWAASLGACAAFMLVGCNSSSGGSSAQMKLAVADAPVDGASHVVVEFTGVELTGADGSPVDITFAAPKFIDLLTQSGTASAVLFDQPIPSGGYGQVRLMVVADGNPSHSYITLSDGTTHGLQVPSGSQTGLKLVSGFTVPGSGVVDYTIDFDLRKAITCPPGQAPVCTLKPAERLVADTAVGNIQGIVSATLVPSGCSPAVYLYSGTVTTPEDYNSLAATTDTNQPIASRIPAVSAQSQGGYYYQFTFLTPGMYTVAFTCAANLDNPDQADATVTFSNIKSGIAVAATQTTTVNEP